MRSAAEGHRAPGFVLLALSSATLPVAADLFCVALLLCSSAPAPDPAAAAAAGYWRFLWRTRGNAAGA